MDYFKQSARIFLGLLSLSSFSANALELTPYESCLNKVLQQSADDMTVAEIKQACINRKMATLPLEKRRLNEQLTEENPFVLTPHHLNYAILGYYANGANKAPFEDNVGHSLNFQDQEVQFQLSFKFPLAKDLPVLGRNLDVYAAYTSRSFWQFFDDKDSIPFRETNHEPEVWAEFHADIDFLDFNLHKVAIGLNHQSNGQSGTLSRGWNRLFWQGFLQHKNSYVSFKTWLRFEESDEFDNQFDYAKYLGDYEIEAAYKLKEHSFGLKVRNRYIFNEYGSVQLDYTYPLTKRLKGYVQWFSGYGESLIDLDYHTNKIGIGIVLADRI
ncbi:MAG: phospholipase A [Thiomicrorhabdus sp.]|jgi:phospholipase A1|nr:phospholipase A [Thiomicrorhabdus sp.]